MVDVVILNGVSSVGKSTTALAVQNLARQPLIRVAMDDYLAMLPPQSFNTVDGLTFREHEINGNPAIEVISGRLVHAALDQMRRTIAAFAGESHRVIVDDVLFEGTEFAAYRSALTHYVVKWVALVAPLALAEERERKRGDRAIGLARWQFDRVHRGIQYDLTIDTSTGSPEKHAATICEAFDL
ncbi:MAG: chloramphenicol phosphotransferase CPT family protein [Parasphingopyxis sp.]